jgi:hypothetical protein
MKCYRCDSSIDENCAILRGKIESIECNGNCSVWIDGMKTIRGCKSDKLSSVKLFENCDSDECNLKKFPENRIECVKCSEFDPNCFNPAPSLLRPCRNYVPNDLCYTIVLFNGGAARGCVSDQDEGVKLCDSFSDECIKCVGTSCNSLSGTSRVQCIECYDNGSCGYTQNNVNSHLTPCEAFLGRDNFCFAFTNQTTYIRGCLNDFPDLKSACSENSEFCQICADDFCNDMKMIAEFCVECDSASCKNLMTGVAVPMVCGEATYDRAGCYLSDKGERLNLLNRKICKLIFCRFWKCGTRMHIFAQYRQVQ